MEVNENEMLSKIKVRHKIKQRNRDFTTVCKSLFSIIFFITSGCFQKLGPLEYLMQMLLHSTFNLMKSVLIQRIEVHRQI